MKKHFLLLMLFSSLQLFSQRYKILFGDLKSLKGIYEYNCVFDYKGMQVNGFDSEEAFLKEKIEKRKKYDDGKDLKGKAESFEKDWFEDRIKKYEPAFMNYFNTMLEKENVKATKSDQTKYTMSVKQYGYILVMKLLMLSQLKLQQ